ncbi:MAG: carboxypeptidase regulatory-like domain-containing protein [Bryobacteraceae bacterium]|nr:carboxypeptidase regulatory-like domain-containing protein [Bryobacteraceae bacterium]
MTICRAACLVLLAIPSLFGQAQSTSGDLKGKVVDPTGAAIASAKLTITNTGRGITRASTSDGEGGYNIPLLPPGVYRLRVEADGFKTQVLDDITIRVGDIVELEIALTVGNVSSEIEVRAEVPVVETERYQQATTIEQQRIRDLPINRRNYLDFVLLAPATADTSDTVDGADYRVAQTPQSGVSFGGGNGRGNGFFIDGVENFVNSGGVRPSVSQEAVQEFQVNRNSFSAEFSWASGGVVNIITKSGANDYRGNVFGFLRHRAIQARNFFDPTKSSFTRVQSGATFGGPLAKDKTFFFLAYERLDRQETAFVPILQDTTAFTRLTASQQELVNFFNASGSPLLRGLAAQANQLLIPGNNPRVNSLFNRNSGRFPFSEDSQMFSARLDHRFSDSHNAFLRANWSDINQSNAQFGALIAYNRGRSNGQWDGTVMFNDSLVLSPKWVVETRAMYNYNRLDVIPTDPNGPEINITGYGFFGRDIFLPSTSYERHYQILQNWNFHSGDHDLKFGFDINPVRNNVYSETFFSGRFGFGEAVPLANVLASAAGDPNFPTTLAGILTQAGQQRLIPNLSAPINALQAFSLGLPTFYQQGFGDPRWIGWSQRYGFYAQHSFRPAERFTLNLGFRYDLERNEEVIGTDPNNFAPRIGFAWQPIKDGKMVVRGGYGIYYTPTNLQVAQVADTLSGAYINQIFVPLTGLPVFLNPATGRPLTSADVYQGLVARGVIGNRAITAADIAPFGLRPGPGLPLRVVFGAEPVRNGYAQQGSLEIEKGFGDFAVSVGYNYNRTLGIARITGRNVFYTGRFRANGSPIYGFYDPLVLQRNIFTFDGNSSFHAGIVQLTKRFSRNFALNAHYTFSKAIDDVTDFNSDFSPFDQLNARGERGLSPFHHAHRFVFNAVIQSPIRNYALRDWNLSPIVVTNSWRPFNILTGVDINEDRYVTNDRPFGAGRNIGRGPNFFTFDLRLSRRFGLGADGKRNLEFIAEGFNLLNRTNFRTVNNTVGNVPLSSLPNPIRGIRGVPTQPLAFTSAYDSRQFQFGAKINF